MFNTLLSVQDFFEYASKYMHGLNGSIHVHVVRVVFSLCEHNRFAFLGNGFMIQTFIFNKREIKLSQDLS